MKTFVAGLVVVVLMAGCVSGERKPRWEVTVKVNVVDQVNPMVKVDGGVELKRGLGGK